MIAEERATPAKRDVLRGPRRRASYNAAERQFSVILQQHLHDLLEGKRNHLELLRQYPNQPDRLGVMPTPASVVRDQLRLPVIETLVWHTIDFVRLKAAGGPVSQQTTPNGDVIEVQAFPTKFPHIVLQRTDRYRGDESTPSEITWCISRLQNQRTQTRINRLLDGANLVFELVRFVW